jgi:hypothetical protein
MDATRPVTPASPATTVMRALLDRARLCTREAGLKGNASPSLAGFRAALRAETEACNELAATIRDMDNPGALDALLTSLKEQTMTDYMDTYRDDWKEIVERPDGTLNLDQIARELADYGDLMRWVTETYDGVTGGLISKPNARPSAVTGIVDERIDAAEREAIEELMRNLEGEAPRSFASVAEVVALIRELAGFAPADH